jgi:polar amino acid transport system substrate-binding protein
MISAPAIARVLDLTAEQSLVSSVAAARVGVQSGRYALTLGPTIDTADAEKDADVITWVKTLLGIVHRNDLAVSDVQDFCGRSIGMVGGSVPLERLMAALVKVCKAAGKPEPTVSSFGDQNAMILALEARRIEAAAMSYAAALYAEKMRAPRLKAFAPEGDVFGTALNSGLLTRKADPRLGEAVLAAMLKVKAAGLYAAILDKYNIGAIGLARIELNPITAAAPR